MSQLVTGEAGPIRMSASRMKTWMACPLQAHFQYDDKLPRVQNSSATFGNCVHHALKIYNDTDGDIDQAVAAFLAVWAQPETIKCAIDVWTPKTSYDSFKKRGLAMLRDYHQKMRWETRDVLATEHKFAVPFGDFELVGFVDLVELRLSNLGQTELHVVDYKTNKKQPYMTALPWDVQFTIYSFAAMQREFWVGHAGNPGIPNGEDIWDEFHTRVPKAYWFHLQTAKEIFAGPRDDPDFMRLYQVCKQIQRADEHQVYVPNISGDSCGFCPYQEPCGLPIPRPEDDWD